MLQIRREFFANGDASVLFRFRAGSRVAWYVENYLSVNWVFVLSQYRRFLSRFCALCEDAPLACTTTLSMRMFVLAHLASHLEEHPCLEKLIDKVGNLMFSPGMEIRKS